MSRDLNYQLRFMPLSPFDALGDYAKKYASELAQELGTTQDLAACALLSTFAAAQVGVRCDVSKNHQVKLSLYMAAGAPPSAGKSPLIKRVTHTLFNIINNHILLSPDEIDKRKVRVEMLIEKRKKIRKKFSTQKSSDKQDAYVEEVININKEIQSLEIPISPLMGKMSIQSFPKELSLRNGRGVIIDAEGGILSELNTVSTTELISLLQAWSNEEITDITSKKNIRIESPSLFMMSMWQSEPLIEILQNPKYFKNGLVARFLVYIEYNWQPQSGHGNVSDESESWYKRQLEVAFCHAMQCVKCNSSVCNLSLSEEAHLVLQSFKECISFEMNNSPRYKAFKEIIGKITTQAIRLAIVIFSMENKNLGCKTIDEKSMYNACCLSIYFAEFLINILDNSYHEKMIRESWIFMYKIADWQKNGNGMPNEGFDVEEPRRRLKLSKAKCDYILYWMQDKGWIQNQKYNKIDQTGRNEEIEVWVPTVDFRSLIVSLGGVYD